MFSPIRQAFGLLHVTEGRSYITVEGVPFRTIERDIIKLLNTSKVSANMFRHVSSSKLIFNKWYAPEVVYLLTELINAPKQMHTNRRVLKKIVDALLEETWLKSTTAPVLSYPLDLNRLKDLDLEPLDFQMEFFHYFNDTVPRYGLLGALLAAAPGSGKTYMSLALAHCAKAEVVIIVSPKNAVNRVWEANIQARFKGTKKYWLSTSMTSIDSSASHFVFHYEALEKALQAVNLFRGRKVVVILDESHNLNTSDSTRTLKFTELCKAVNASIVLEQSGTPIKALGSEAIPLLKAIDPLFTPEVEESFKKIYGLNSTKALTMLSHRMGLVSFKVEKERLKLDKPIDITVNIETPDSKLYTLAAVSADMKAFTTAQLAMYDKLKDSTKKKYFELVDKAQKRLNSKLLLRDFEQYAVNVETIREWGSKGQFDVIKTEMLAATSFEKQVILGGLEGQDKADFKHVKSLYKYVQLKVQGEALGRILGKKRIDCHVSMIPYIKFDEIVNSSIKKTLVFTSWVEVLEKSIARLTELGFNPLSVYGKTNNNLASIIKDFEVNEDLNPLVATFDSLSTAVPLIMADNMILINTPFRQYILDQTVARINRLGADTQATVYTLLLNTGNEPNLSTRSKDILEWSKEQVDLIMGFKSDFTATANELGDTLTIASEAFDISLEYSANAKTGPVYAGW